MANYHNLWQPAPDGRSVIDISDVISVHIYNAADAARQLDEIRAHTSKPILIEEFGWPSGPPCYKPGFTEAQQAEVYRQMVQAAEGRAAGVFAWTLRDYDAGPTTRWDTQQEYYGLYRPDDSLKPAAQFLLAFSGAPPLPSTTRMDATIRPDDSRGPDSGTGSKKSVQVGGTSFYVKDMFRRAWDNLGGQGTLGLPLSDAFVNPGDGKIVQYFEAAVLELYPDAQFDPDFSTLSELDQIMRLVRPAYLGYLRKPKEGFPPSDSPPPNSRYFPETGYYVKDQFWSAYENLLGLWRFGAPISGEMSEQINGTDMTVQYFEKGRLELNPQFNQVVPGQMGTWAWQLRCNSTQ
jgi:hypothetical protein